MRTSIMLVLAALLAPSLAAAQPGPQRKALQGETRIRYLLIQAELSPDQQKQADALLEVYRAQIEEEKKNPEEFVAKIRAVYEEVMEAKNAGDTERAKQLEKELRSMAPGAQAERDFFIALDPTLTAKQKARLERAKTRLNRRGQNPEVTPADVLDAARAMDLSPAQQEKVDDVEKRIREKVGQAGAMTDMTRERLIDETVDLVKRTLTSEQAKEFEQEIKLMRKRPDVSSQAKPGEKQEMTKGAHGDSHDGHDHDGDHDKDHDREDGGGR